MFGDMWNRDCAKISDGLSVGREMHSTESL